MGEWTGTDIFKVQRDEDNNCNIKKLRGSTWTVLTLSEDDIDCIMSLYKKGGNKILSAKEANQKSKEAISINTDRLIELLEDDIVKSANKGLYEISVYRSSFINFSTLRDFISKMEKLGYKVEQSNVNERIINISWEEA